MQAIRLSLAMLICLACAAFAPAWAGSRIALVVGNSAYDGVPALPNPANDAEDVAAALTAAGFDVRLERNLRKPQFEDSLRRFVEQAQTADASLFYYAGHGLQFDNENYLVPVDAKLSSASAIRFELIDVGSILKGLDGAPGPRLVVLDACRDNPLLVRLKETMPASRSMSLTRGLARISADPGTLVAYSTQSGQTAVDGDGRNSPFSAAFIQQAKVPGLEIGVFFRRVAAAVNEATKGQQLPEVSISLTTEFYLSGQADASSPGIVEPSSTEIDVDRQTQLALWGAAERSNRPAGYEAYLKAFPDGLFSEFAKQRLTDLRKEAALTPVAPAPALQAPVKAPEPSATDIEQTLNLSKEDRLALEVALLKEKANPGNVDGYFDTDARAGIRTWQYNQNLEVTGFLTRDQVNKLIGKSTASTHSDKIAAIFSQPPVGADERMVRVIGALSGQTFTYATFGGHLYAALMMNSRGEGISFSAARALAEGAGGYLATIGSAAENNAVFSLIKDDPRFWWGDNEGFVSGPWIGYYQAPGSRSSRVGWTWVKGGQGRFTNWDRSKGQPNEIDLGSGPGAAAFGGGSGGDATATWQDAIMLKQSAPGLIIEFD